MAGRVDYCVTGGQALFDSFARGLERFQLQPTEIQALLVMMQETREQARSEAARKFNGGPCPEDVRERIQQARGQIEDAWRALVQDAANIDLRPSVAKALSQPMNEASSSPPAPTPASTTSSPGLCTKGQAVSVLYAGEWYPAKVLDGPDRMGTCLVSYDGYASNWDEWVNASRMRPASAQPVAAAQQPQALPASIPPGKYSCYTFD
ncbi:MAG: agenet domain-containing protein, partial [Rhodospirillaceae bacterium]